MDCALCACIVAPGQIHLLGQVLEYQDPRCAIDMTYLAEHWCIFMKSSHYNEKEVIQHFPCEDVYLLFIQIKSTKMSILFMCFIIGVQKVCCSLSLCVYIDNTGDRNL